MTQVVCPHCGAERGLHSNAPRDVVVIMPCPACHELIVLYREKAIALNRDILDQGTFEERKSHIADIVAEFMEAGMFDGLSAESMGEMPRLAAPEESSDHESPDAGEDAEPVKREEGPPITQQEVDEFVRIDLLRIDEASYFKEHFS